MNDEPLYARQTPHLRRFVPPAPVPYKRFSLAALMLTSCGIVVLIFSYFDANEAIAAGVKPPHLDIMVGWFLFGVGLALSITLLSAVRFFAWLTIVWLILLLMLTLLGTLHAAIARDARSCFFGVVYLWTHGFALYLTIRCLTWREDAVAHCHVCGYDLRATPHRCPECGTPATEQLTTGN